MDNTIAQWPGTGRRFKYQRGASGPYALRIITGRPRDVVHESGALVELCERARSAREQLAADRSVHCRRPSVRYTSDSMYWVTWSSIRRL